jgi:endonuclease/exonuclease/phosphatase family metal-dependent hydrolase
VAIRLASFNLESLDAGPKVDPPFAARRDLLRLQLERLKADILCLQEVNAQEAKRGGHSSRELTALQALLEGTRYADYQRIISRNRAQDKIGDIHNLVILSRLPVVASRQIWHDLVPEPMVRLVTALPQIPDPQPIAWDRPVLHAELALPGGQRLHVLNVHFRAPLATAVPGQKLDSFAWRSIGGWAEGYYLSSIKRAGQALEVRRALDQLLTDDPMALIAVAGDYNAEEHHTPVELVRGEEENTANGELAMQIMVPAEHAAAESDRFTVVHQGRRLMLDHILVSRALLGRLGQVDIHNEALADELVGYASVRRSPESYHAPLVAEFDLSS